MEPLAERELLFCAYYSNTHSAREAAARAGYRRKPELNGLRLLEKDCVRAEIERLELKRRTAQEIREGYRRLAFGPVTDAVRLLFLDEAPSPGQLEEMDLFSIAEMKRPRAGGVELKFFDRLKALEKLSQMEEQAVQDSALPFYEALEQGAQALRREGGRHAE